MRSFWPLVLVIAGVSLLFGAPMYEATFSGVPHIIGNIPDEVWARSKHHHRVATCIWWTGAVANVVGVIAWFARGITRRVGTHSV